VTQTVTIALADDHHLVRQALRTLLETESEFTVVAEASDGLEAVQVVERLGPEILVVDLMMPGLNGTEVARQVSRKHPETRVIVLSMHVNEAHVMEALHNGASGYVRKDATAADLIRAIREVAAGHLYLSPPFADNAIEAYRKRAEEAAVDPYRDLTDREREVLHLAAEGLGNTEIGVRLGISPRTAETHRANVMKKLGLHRQIDLVRFALRRGIVSADEEPPSGA
jgi:two-component system, NarL family, response regulator NreC